MRLLRSAALSGSFLLAVIAACGTDGGSAFGGGGGDGGADGSSGGFVPTPGFGDDDKDASGPPIVAPIEITPANQVVDVLVGNPAPTITYVAKIIATGEEVPAIFSIDRGELGAIDKSTGVFTAGTIGGVGTITATWRGNTATTNVTLRVKAVENGADPSVDAGVGAGGNGGVGGHGPGISVDESIRNVLHGTPTADSELKMLYPYDGTVFPRGILSPLLMWKPGTPGTYDAILIRLKETNFEYEGTFASNGSPFQDHPISQNVWKQLAQSNGGEEVEVSIVLARNGTAYGPLTSKWKIASAPLKGVVYYNSYGTKLALNFTENGVTFGGATLGIRGDSPDPFLVAGGNGSEDYCRVCHSVAADGSKLITQRNRGPNRRFSTYDLKQTPAAETRMTPSDFGADPPSTKTWAWPAIYPDGSIFLGDSSSADGSSNITNRLYNTVSGTEPAEPAEIPISGWPTGLRAAFPAFSPDGKKVVFTKYACDASVGGCDQRTLATMDFDKGTSTFSNLTELHRPANAAHFAMYGAFLPTNDAVVYHVNTRMNTRDSRYGETRGDSDTAAGAADGSRAELWWVNATGTPQPARLDKLNGMINGTSYLPTGPNLHDHDYELNYEPTVNPVPSGGYAWVVFTSRRLYGNVATMHPYRSDPRHHSLATEPTTKKLWVAAIDLNAPPGTDPSHPAFYLPGQELLAGNMRGYWVVDPCKADNSSCETGDECCGGFCRPNDSGALVCSNVVPTCAQEFERCSVNADCCNSDVYTCINGRCAQKQTGPN